MARFSPAAQDRRVLTTTVWEEALGPDMSTIQVYPADPYRSHPNPNPTRRPRPDAYPELEVAHDPERPCREAEAPVEGRFQGSALRGIADPAGRLLVSALPAQLPRHRGTVPQARSGGGPLHAEPLGS